MDETNNVSEGVPEYLHAACCPSDFTFVLPSETDKLINIEFLINYAMQSAVFIFTVTKAFLLFTGRN